MSERDSDARRGDAHDDGRDAQTRRPGRPWLVAFGFLLALAATVLTVILTGLMLRG